LKQTDIKYEHIYEHKLPQDDSFSLLREKIQSMEEDLQILCENNLDGKNAEQVRKELYEAKGYEPKQTSKINSQRKHEL